MSAPELGLAAWLYYEDLCFEVAEIVAKQGPGWWKKSASPGTRTQNLPIKSRLL